MKVLHPGEEGEVCLSVCLALFTSNLGIKNERIRIGKRRTGNKERGREVENKKQGTDNREQRAENREQGIGNRE